MKLCIGFIFVMLFVIGFCGCGPDNSDTGTNSDSDSDADNDTDTDIDTDTDSDTDTTVVPCEWITIKAGSFWMGSPDGDCPSDYPGGADCAPELGRFDNEDLHYVTLTRSFEIQSTEVTQGQFLGIGPQGHQGNYLAAVDLDGQGGLAGNDHLFRLTQVIDHLEAMHRGQSGPAQAGPPADRLG